MEPSASIWSVLGTVSFFVGVVFLIAAAFVGVMALIVVVIPRLALKAKGTD